MMSYNKCCTILILALFNVSCDNRPNCSDFTWDIIENNWLISSHDNLNSSFLESIEFYGDDNLFTSGVYAVCYLRDESFYTYEIDKTLMKKWKRYAKTDKCGEAWHEYIEPYKLDCKNN